jgi:hypothetical protein
MQTTGKYAEESKSKKPFHQALPFDQELESRRPLMQQEKKL